MEKGESGSKKWVFSHKDTDTGKKRYVQREVKKPKLGEMPPAEIDGVLKISQQTPIIGEGYVPTQRRQRRGDFPTFIDKSQPTGDKD